MSLRRQGGGYLQPATCSTLWSKLVGAGLWACMLMERFPSIPAAEEGQLHDPLLRETFIERVLALSAELEIRDHA